LKKYYQCPNDKNFIKDSIAEIYTDYRHRTKYEGRARLLEEVDTGLSPECRIYVRIEIGSSFKQSPHTIYWSWKKWKIIFIDGPNKGWITSRKISHFISIGLQKKLK